MVTRKPRAPERSPKRHSSVRTQRVSTRKLRSNASPKVAVRADATRQQPHDHSTMIKALEGDEIPADGEAFSPGTLRILELSHAMRILANESPWKAMIANN